MVPLAPTATAVIAMCILKQALSATVCISLLKHLDWVRPASAPSTMMRCTDISTWSRRKNRSYTNLQLVIPSPTRVSRHPMKHQMYGRKLELDVWQPTTSE
jgi:hypothetical protein